MRGPVYSQEELIALQESPLVRKPDGLPSISQWMDVPADQGADKTHNNSVGNNNGTVRRTRGPRDGEGIAIGEQRPLINNPMGQFGRRQSMQPGEETVLGPPKLSFASSRPGKFAGDGKERTGITSTDGDSLGDRFPRDKNERWTRDRDADRTRDTKGFANGRRGGREDGEGWTSVKGRKSVGQEDFERFSRNGDRNREKLEGDPESELASRRPNRERTEPRWGRREDREDVTKTGVQGGWRDRDRERERERDRDRDWTRGGQKADEDPEWMDTKIEKQQPKARTQEDFQRWKESMRAKDTPADDRHEPKEHIVEPTTATGITSGPMLTAPLHTPSAVEPTQGYMFGNWGKDKSAEVTPIETVSAKPKTDKKSRFMGMFAKPDEPAAPAQPAAPLGVAMAPPPSNDAEAKEGFQRILQMLGQSTPQPGLPTPTNGARHGGGVSLDFHQQPSLPESPNVRAPGRTLEQQNILESILAPRPPMTESRPSQQQRFSSMSPEHAANEQFRPPRPDSSQPEDHFSRQPPPQRNNPQDANLAAVLNSRARDESQRDQATKQRERDFLLTLMQQPSRGTPPLMLGQNLARNTQENMGFYDPSRQQPPQQAKGRNGAPPGFMDGQHMFNEADIMRREADTRREQELRQQLNIQQQQQQQQLQQHEAMRNKNARMPPMGFPGHEDALMGLQRRNTGGDPRLATNMGIPSQPMPDLPYVGGRGQPGMPPTSQERPGIAPPPGFGGPMRQPPGLSGPNAQQMGPGGPSFSAGNTPLGHPPGFPPPGSNMRGLGFPGGPGVPGGNSMPGPPQGYFPPGYGHGPPPPGMREDPRMMFGGQFDGPGPRQQPGRPGPPPNMY